MRTVQNLIFALAAVLLSACDPGFSTEELETELRPHMLGGVEMPGCEAMSGAPQASYEAFPYPDEPGLVIVRRDGYPVCVDTTQAVAQKASELGLHIAIPAPVAAAGKPQGPTPVAEGQPGLDEHSNDIGDDPIPLGKSDRVQDGTPEQ